MPATSFAAICAVAAGANVDQVGRDVGRPAAVGEMNAILDRARDALGLCADDPQVGVAGVPRLTQRRQLDVADLLQPELRAPSARRTAPRRLTCPSPAADGSS